MRTRARTTHLVLWPALQLAQDPQRVGGRHGVLCVLLSPSFFARVRVRVRALYQ
jgi:hypothetical protein